VQLNLDRLAEWRLSDLQIQAAPLVDQQRGLHRFMSDGSEVAGIFSATIMRKLQAIAEKLVRLQANKNCNEAAIWTNADVCAVRR
jgi:hypothetical protein